MQGILLLKLWSDLGTHDKTILEGKDIFSIVVFSPYLSNSPWIILNERFAPLMGLYESCHLSHLCKTGIQRKRLFLSLAF